MVEKNNEKYWKQRFEELEHFNHQRGKSFYHEIEKQYQNAMSALEKDISSWYIRFSRNNEISYQEARCLLNSRELKEFRWNVDQYMQKAKDNIDGRWSRQLENASAKVHITRLDALEMQMQQHIEELFGNYNDQTGEYLSDLYTDNFYRTAYEIARGTGVGTNFARLDKKMVDLVIHKPWASDGKEFSGRIWENRSKLVNTLHSELTTAIIKGDAPQKTIKAVAKKMDVSRSQAENLVLTETAALSSRATQDSYQELGLKRYEILATLDSRTSEICRSMDRKKFETKDYQVGVTAPPFHPRCRTTTIPDVNGDILGERAARSDGKTYYIPADMTYQQWKNKFARQSQKKTVPKIQIKDVDNAESFKNYSDKEIRDISKNMNKLADKYINNKSKWSGKVLIDPSDNIYGKRWNCDISTPSETCPHILLHEQIHAHSISYFTPRDYMDNYKIEEAAVQFLAQEISNRENIEIIQSQYDEMVATLREINQIAKISGSDYEFAVELIETPVPERLAWIEQKIFAIMMKGGTVEEYERLTELLESLRV